LAVFLLAAVKREGKRPDDTLIAILRTGCFGNRLKSEVGSMIEEEKEGRVQMENMG
jgi:hypothetical protein